MVTDCYKSERDRNQADIGLNDSNTISLYWMFSGGMFSHC